MLYIHKNNDNIIMTDSVIDYIPSTLVISLDDELIGTFSNESTYKNYILVTIPAAAIANIRNAEHQIKFSYYSEIIKQELCMVKDSTVIELIISKTKTNKIIAYEKH